MVIEKKYYDIAQRELEEMQRELNEEKAQMSEEEILEDKKWHDETCSAPKKAGRRRAWKKSSTSIPRKSAIFLIIHLRCGWTLPCRK